MSDFSSISDKLNSAAKVRGKGYAIRASRLVYKSFENMKNPGSNGNDIYRGDVA